MFSTALETMKFLSETSPIIGLSPASGTSTFLAPALEYLVESGIWIVPVFLSLNVPGSGLACPLGRPNVAPAAVWVWDPVGFN